MEVKSDKNFELNTDTDKVWNVLIIPKKVVTCIPGAELTETIDENHLKGKVTIKIGPVTAKFNGDVEIDKREKSNYELAMTGSGSDISGKGGAAMSMWLKLNALETGTEVRCRMTVSITGRIAQFGGRMIEAVNNKMFEQFISNFTNMMEQGNGSESTAVRLSESEPVKAGSLVRSVIVSELKKNLENKQNQSERNLESLNYS